MIRDDLRCLRLPAGLFHGFVGGRGVGRRGAGSPAWFFRHSRRLVTGGAVLEHSAFLSVSRLVGWIVGVRVRGAVPFYGFVAPVGGAWRRVSGRCGAFRQFG
jgi:hypothetical protein